MEVSVIIPMYNEGERIASCLKSIKSQDFGRDYEIIVVDNKSSDDSVEIAKAFGVRIVSEPGHLGMVRQRGIEESKGEYIAFLDADQIAFPDWLAQLYKKRGDGDFVIGSEKALDPADGISRYFDDVYRLDSVHRARCLPNTVGFGTNFLARRAVAMEISFDKSLPTAEDGDFSYRALKKGYTAVSNPDALVYHAVPHTLKGFYQFHRKLALGQMLLYRKHRDVRWIREYLLNTLYPVTPLYWTRAIHAGNKLNFILLGLFKTLVWASILVDGSLLRDYSVRKVLRAK